MVTKKEVIALCPFAREISAFKSALHLRHPIKWASPKFCLHTVSIHSGLLRVLLLRQPVKALFRMLHTEVLSCGLLYSHVCQNAIVFLHFFAIFSKMLILNKNNAKIGFNKIKINKASCPPSMCRQRAEPYWPCSFLRYCPRSGCSYI